MVKSDIISATKANRLYWLGRYEMRVYLTLHQLNKCCDEMIDGSPEAYHAVWAKLDALGNYKTNDEFTLGMLYDEDNPSSVISAQKYAMDNAILLREDIMSETLSYLEMSVALMKRCKEADEKSLATLQPIIDWSLAFWGSAEQRIQNHRALNIMMIGRNIENLDILIRFGYPYRRIALAYESLKRYCEKKTEILDENISSQLDELITEEKFNLDDMDYKFKLINKNKSAGYESVVLDEKDLCNVIARRAGIFYRLKNTGMAVKEGDVLAQILDPYDSSVLEEVKAPVDGVVFFAHNKPLALEHAILYRIIKEEEI